MQRIRALVVAALVGGAGGACDTAEVGDTAETPETTTEQPTLAPAPDGGEAMGEGGAMLGVDTLQGAGAYLTDGQGRALYLLEGEPSDSSTCYDECAREWPPFLGSGGTPQATGQEIRSDLIGTIERRGGGTQVTYGGHALYYYHDDTGPGQTTGQDVHDQWGGWYLVKPDGEQLEGTGG